MLRERKDYPKVVSPRGVAIWPALNEPDYKFKKEFGEYHARLRVSPDDPALAPILAAAEEILDEAFEAKQAELTRQKKGALLKGLSKAPILREEVDPESGEPTGYLIFRGATNAGGKKKDGKPFSKTLDFFDRRGTQLKNPPAIGGGSELKLGVRIMDYETDGGKTIGVRFDLEGVQILKAVSGGQRTADYYGFGEEEGDDIEDGVNTGGFADEGSGENDGDF